MTKCPHCDENHGTGVDFCPRSGRPIVDVAKRLLGRVIQGKYRLIDCIGQGGMGTIFEAEHEIIGNRVAVKMLHEMFSGKKEPVQRLYREAKATGAIGHPNIIKVFDVGVTDKDVPYLVMELLKGQSLGDVIAQQGPLSLKMVLEISIQMLSALQAAHKAGVIHRDLKCDNIFLLDTPGEDIQTKILDFGISKFMNQEVENLRLTQTGSVLGTPYYMSPEQASGSKDLDHRIDIYSAGVIIYEALVGAMPHQGTNYNALLMDIISVDAKPFRHMREDVPLELENAVLKALSRNRDTRWSSAVTFKEELEKIRDTIPLEVLREKPHIKRDDTFALRTSKTVELDKDDSKDFLLDDSTEDYSTTSRFSVLSTQKKVISVVVVTAVAMASLFLLVVFPSFSASEDEGLKSASLKQEKSDNINTVSNVPLEDAVASQKNKVVSPVEDSLVSISKVKEPKASATIKLVVQREPAQAKVLFEGQAVPVDGLSVAKGDTPVELLVRSKGFETKTVKVIPKDDIEIAVKLKRLHKSLKKKKNKENTAVENKTVAAEKPEKAPKPKNFSLDRPMDNPF